MSGVAKSPNASPSTPGVPISPMSPLDVKRIIRNYLWKIAAACGGILTILITLSGYVVNQYSYAHGYAEAYQSASDDIRKTAEKVGEAYGSAKTEGNAIAKDASDYEKRIGDLSAEQKQFSDRATDIINDLTAKQEAVKRLMEQENASANQHYELLAQSLASTSAFRSPLVSAISPELKALKQEVYQLVAVQQSRIQVLIKPIRLDGTNCKSNGTSTSLCNISVASPAVAGKTIIAAMLSQPTDGAGHAETIVTLNGFNADSGSVYVSRPWQANWSPEFTDTQWRWAGQLVIFYK